ncbi:hypothetical protein [Vibrio chagasii]|uniref:hypothetical protein n=1 Tax=Vibrio chagasii TaxID=170679 RepID=UPI003D9FDFAA
MMDAASSTEQYSVYDPTLIDDWENVDGEKWDLNSSQIAMPNNFIPRFYQESLFEHILGEHYEYQDRKAKMLAETGVIDPIGLGAPPSWNKKCLQVLHRRAGKDIGALHILASAACFRVGKYYHVMPFKTQARQAIWNGRDDEGNSFIDTAFPPQIVKRKSESQMMIELTNGSMFQLIAADVDKNVGTNAHGIIFSESALMPRGIRTYFLPMLDNTKGWEIHITTPRGKNWLYELACHAETADDWYYDYLSIKETWRWAWTTQDISGLVGQANSDDYDSLPVYDELPEGVEVKFKNANQFREERFGEDCRLVNAYKVRLMLDRHVESAIAEGEDPQEVKQEYYISWDAALKGSYYMLQMERMQDEQRIGRFPHNPNKPVYVHLDLGYNDLCAVTFTQEAPNGAPVIIDYKSGSGTSLLDWCYWIEERANECGYQIGLIVMPHDANQTEVATGMTRLEYVLKEGSFEARGFNFEVLPIAPKKEGIEVTRKVLNEMMIDESAGSGEFGLIESLKSYKRKFNVETQTYSNNPVHDWSSHGADVIRYLCSSWEDVVRVYWKPRTRAYGNRIARGIKVKRALSCVIHRHPFN